MDTQPPLHTGNSEPSGSALSGTLLYAGKSKKVYATDDPERVRVVFTDAVTAGDGAKRREFPGKGELAARTSALLFRALASKGIRTHFLRELAPAEHLVRRVRIIPLEVVVRFLATGSLSRRLGIPEGRALPFPLVELYYKSDALGDPLLADDHVALLGLASPEVVAYLKDEGRRAAEALREIFAAVELILVDVKFEYGETSEGEIVLADELSPDSMRIWTKDGERLDKDRFRRDMGDLLEGYAFVYRRLAERFPEFASP
ncbi:MAG: phosphoribosylaminoimidazolesuccinocarboxamide synthase [Brockia lithotrophica]|nr:phosphoribosylaminoimidazolesuccinocarboxamide synthase [Brockia lithotrophica]